MFQAVPPPIIRSSKLYIQHRVFVELFLLLTAIMGELELTHTQTQTTLDHNLILKQIITEIYIYVCMK
jgi:hypothetical protein